MGEQPSEAHDQDVHKTLETEIQAVRKDIENLYKHVHDIEKLLQDAKIGSQ